MFATGVRSDGVTLGSAALPVDLAALITVVNSLGADGSDGLLIDQIGSLERLKSCCAAAQAVLTHALVASQTAEGAARKVRPEVTRRSVAAQIGLARRQSRHRGGLLMGLAGALVMDMPCTLAALRSGETSERRAQLILTEFACLTRADRRHADAQIGPELPALGDMTTSNRAATIAYRLDVEAVMGKVRGAVADRHVSIRPAPDTMTRLSALLPVAQGVAIYAALRIAADSAVGTGDGRTRGQLMADNLVSRVIGQQLAGCDPYGVPSYVPDCGTTATSDAPKTAESGHGADERSDESSSAAESEQPDQRHSAETEVDELRAAANASAAALPGDPCCGPAGLQLHLIMTDRTLLGDDDEPAHLTGYGPVPAPLARALVLGQTDTPTRTFVRRLYTHPSSGQLVAMDSRQRLFPDTVKNFLIARDQLCRTPWCDAPIRHLDHIVPYARGGLTNLDNGQGLCAGCNLSKAASGWQSQTRSDDQSERNSDNTVQITTPTGHTYRSEPPRPPTSPPWPDISFIEAQFSQMILELR